MNSPFQDWQRAQRMLMWYRRGAYFALGLLFLAIALGEVPF